MRVLDHVQRRIGPGQRCGVEQSGEPPPSGVALNVGNFGVGIGDAEQVVEQAHIFGIVIGKADAELGACGCGVETFDPQAGAQ